MLRILFLCFAATSGVEEQLPITPTTAWDNVRASGGLYHLHKSMKNTSQFTTLTQCIGDIMHASKLKKKSLCLTP